LKTDKNENRLRGISHQHANAIKNDEKNTLHPFRSGEGMKGYPAELLHQAMLHFISQHLSLLVQSNETEKRSTE